MERWGLLDGQAPCWQRASSCKPTGYVRLDQRPGFKSSASEAVVSAAPPNGRRTAARATDLVLPILEPEVRATQRQTVTAQRLAARAGRAKRRAAVSLGVEAQDGLTAAERRSISAPTRQAYWMSYQAFLAWARVARQPLRSADLLDAAVTRFFDRELYVKGEKWPRRGTWSSG